jgi:hypothetical protein
LTCPARLQGLELRVERVEAGHLVPAVVVYVEGLAGVVVRAAVAVADTAEGGVLGDLVAEGLDPAADGDDVAGARDRREAFLLQTVGVRLEAHQGLTCPGDPAFLPPDLAFDRLLEDRLERVGGGRRLGERGSGLEEELPPALPLLADRELGAEQRPADPSNEGQRPLHRLRRRDRSH